MGKNPILDKKFKEGHDIGFHKGTKIGFEQGKYSACMHFADKLEGLSEVPGFGPKRIEQLLKYLGAEYRVEK